MSQPGSLRLFTVLLAAIVSVSFGSIFIRLAQAPPLAAAAYRLFWATFILAPFAAAGPLRELRRLSGRDWAGLAFSGVALALHFGLWIASLSHTSVASSVLLVSTSPFFIGIVSHWILGRPHRGLFWAGLGVAFVGCLVIFSGDWSQAQTTLKGNLLALGGAAAVAAYLLAGAQLRPKLSLLLYVWPVYAVALASTLVACAATGVPLGGYSLRTHTFLFLLGLVPQCIGHTSYNWALRWLRPALVGMVTLAEPVGATALAYLLLRESLTWSKILGGLIILGGIYMASKAEGEQS
jgi:drug/metabolite transporter (DMT)-like permease